MLSRHSNPFAKMIAEQLDRIECLYSNVKNGNMSTGVINCELGSIIRLLGVNLRLTSCVSSMKEIDDLVEYIRSILILACSKDHITTEIYHKNIMLLSKTLKSCETLPNSFVNDLISRLSIQNLHANSVNSLN